VIWGRLLKSPSVAGGRPSVGSEGFASRSQRQQSKIKLKIWLKIRSNEIFTRLDTGTVFNQTRKTQEIKIYKKSAITAS